MVDAWPPSIWVGGGSIAPLIPSMGWVFDAPTVEPGRRAYVVYEPGHERLRLLGARAGDILVIDYDGRSPEETIAEPNPRMTIWRGPDPWARVRVSPSAPTCDPNDPLCGL
jgi:hypothetical protein